MSLVISCLIQYPMVFAILHFMTVPTADIYPTIHLLPGMNEMIFAVTKQQMNVLTAIHGMAVTVGNASVCLNTITYNPSQNICIRYMP